MRRVLIMFDDISDNGMLNCMKEWLRSQDNILEQNTCVTLGRTSQVHKSIFFKYKHI